MITYTYTDGNSCTGSDTATITVDDCLGIDETAEANTVSVYPNPFSDQAVIIIGNVNNSTMFELFDISGKKIQSFSITSEKTILNRATLASGTYIYKVSDEAGMKETGRLIVQ